MTQQNGQIDQNPMWHSGASQNEPQVPPATPAAPEAPSKQNDIQPHAPPEKEFGSPKKGGETKPGEREDEWAPPGGH